jgi:hypothetical protein
MKLMYKYNNRVSLSVFSNQDYVIENRMLVLAKGQVPAKPETA